MKLDKNISFSLKFKIGNFKVAQQIMFDNKIYWFYHGKKFKDTKNFIELTQPLYFIYNKDYKKFYMSKNSSFENIINLDRILKIKQLL